MASSTQRRPSASLRTRRPSVYNDIEGGEGSSSTSGGPVPQVPALPPNHLTQYFNSSNSGQSRPQRPGIGPSKSSQSSSGAAHDGRSRSGGANSSRQGGNAAAGGESSKVGAYLLNKRQSVSFGKAVASNVRAGVRQDAAGVPAVPGSYGAGPPPSIGIPWDAAAAAPQQQRRHPDQASGVAQRPAAADVMLQPGGGRRGATLEGTMTAGEALVANGPRGPTGRPLQELLKEDFVADAFIKAHLSPQAASNSSIQLDDLRKLKAALSHMLTSTQDNLQKNVIQNYAEFIKVSKDIAALENEMLELKSVLEDWKTVPEGLEIEQSFDPNANSGRNRRNSLADLQALYKTQLEALWDAIEGSQRFLPAIPNRHVLSRHTNWVELNNATYRPRQPVILVLLNDALLVAVEKRRQMGKSVRVVADKCFHLNEIAVTDLKDQTGVTDTHRSGGGNLLSNAIRIKKDREVFIFRTEKLEDKRALLGQFKKILEETMNRKRKESVWEAEIRSTGGLSSSRNGDGGGPNSHPLAGFNPSSYFKFVTTRDGTGKDLSWIDDVSDQLAVHIALREFEQAVNLIETAKAVLLKIEVDPLAESLLRSKIEGRSAELCSVLLANLSDTSIRKTGVVKMSGWLMRLGQGERARETFLAGRGELLKARTGDLRSTSQGDGQGNLPSPQGLVNEVAELAFVCFTLIRNTCEWYMAAYKDHQTASAFVRWASAQVEVFADLFKRQVYHSSACDAATRQRCLETATSQAAMLKDVGLDFAFLLSTALQFTPPPLPPRDEASAGQPGSPEASVLEGVQPLSINKKKSTTELKSSSQPTRSVTPSSGAPVREGQRRPSAAAPSPFNSNASVDAARPAFSRSLSNSSSNLA